MRIFQHLWFGLVCAVGIFTVLSACDSGGTNTPGSVTGSWQGTVETDSVTYQLAFDLARSEPSGPSGPRLIGEGELTGQDSRSFQIPDGSFIEETFSLTLTLRFDESPRPILLEGMVDEEYQSVTADLHGGPPRFDETPITLTRP